MSTSDYPQNFDFRREPYLVRWLGIYAMFGCAIFAISILIADFVVPNHDWVADTISDLGAGKYEYIVDIGIYAFSGSLIALALLSAHMHLGDKRWSFGLIGLAFLALIVFLIGARNEYGDSDQDGAVIHVYLVYVLGVLMTLIPWLMSRGASRVAEGYGKILIGISIVWTISAPIFFFLPDSIDGIYERYLGLIAFTMVATLAYMFMRLSRDAHKSA